MKRQKGVSYTLPILDSLALRVYSNTRPFNWKIANLQKGLILVLDKKELVGAGAGFGFPMLQYSNETYFSGTAKIYKYQKEGSPALRKDFFINMVKRNTFENTSLESSKARNILDFFGEINRKYFRALKLKDFLVKCGVGTKFIKGSSKGKITFLYDVTGDIINVKADFRQLNKNNLMRVAILNEQSSRFFRVYRDSNAEKLVDEKIGSWKLVKGNWANISCLDQKITFKLKKVSGATLYRGQEFIDGFLDWIGLNYDVYVGQAIFEYQIKLFRK